MYVFYFLLVLFVQEVRAESWVCQESAKRFYTNVPTVSRVQRCEPFSLENGSLSKLPPEAMERFVNKPLFKKEEKTDSGLLPRRRIKSSLRYREVNQKYRHKSPRGLNRGCELSGRIYSEEGGPAELKIIRGALTTDRFRIRLPGGKEAFEWTHVVAGHCRNPRVNVSLLR